MDSVVKVAVYIVIGAVVISLAESAGTAPAISAITGGFAAVLSAMKGQQQGQPLPNQQQPRG